MSDDQEVYIYDDLLKSPIIIATLKKGNPPSLIKTVRKKCLDCMAGSSKEVSLCGSGNCPLWPYRFGKNPYHTKTMTDAQKQESRDRLAAIRERRDV